MCNNFRNHESNVNVTKASVVCELRIHFCCKLLALPFIMKDQDSSAMFVPQSNTAIAEGAILLQALTFITAQWFMING